MKFFYDGKLVRTSKTKVYTHAVINTETGGLIGCSSSRELAQKKVDSEISYCNSRIAEDERALKALTSGASGYSYRFGRMKYFSVFGRDCSKNPEEWKQFIREHRERIDYIRRNWKVVELTAQA